MPRLRFRLATLVLLIIIAGMASALVVQQRRMTAMATRVRDLEKELLTRGRNSSGQAIARHWKATLAKNQAMIEAAQKRAVLDQAGGQEGSGLRNAAEKQALPSAR